MTEQRKQTSIEALTAADLIAPLDSPLTDARRPWKAPQVIVSTMADTSTGLATTLDGGTAS